MQDSLESLRDIYLKTTRYVSLVSVPAAICIIVFAPEFINDVYGAKWAPAIIPLQLLGIYGLIRSVAANMGNIFKAGGKPHWLVGIGAFRLTVMAARRSTRRPPIMASMAWLRCQRWYRSWILSSLCC